MKQLILLLLFVGFGHVSFAQNWAPFRIGETYNYIENTPDFVYPSISVYSAGCNGAYPDPPMMVPGISPVTYSNNEVQIWIDTFSVNNGDTIFSFNRRVLPCDTCSTPAILVNQVLSCGMFQEGFVKNNLGQYVFIYEMDSLVIPLYLSLNDSIISDSSSNLWVKNIHLDLDSVWYDSTNTYVIDSSSVFTYVDSIGNLLYQIVLTKNHGIHKFKNFLNFNEVNQVGIESEELGLVQLNWRRIYHYEVGDVFYRQSVYWWNGEINHGIAKEKILSVQNISMDTIIYTMAKDRWWYSNCCPGSTGTLVDTFDIVLTENNMIFGFYSVSDISVTNVRDNEIITQSAYGDLLGETHAMFAKNFLREGNLQYKFLSYNFGLDSIFAMTPTQYLDRPLFIVDTISDTYYQDDFTTYSLKSLYGEGLGSVSSFSSGFEGWSCSALVGCIKGGDTMGTILNDSFFVYTVELQKNEYVKMALHPNPTNKNLTIDLSKMPITNTIQISIIDLHGRVIKTISKSPQSSYNLSVEALSSGIYLLQIKNDSGQILGIKKFVVN